MDETRGEFVGDDRLRRLGERLAEEGMPAVYNPRSEGDTSVTIDLLDDMFEVAVRVGPDDPRGYEVDVWVDDGSGGGDVQDVTSCVYDPWVFDLVTMVVQHIVEHGSMPVTEYRPVLDPAAAAG